MFVQTIQDFSDSLESLRDFVEVMGSFLSEQSSREVKSNLAGFAALILVMLKMGQVGSGDRIDLDGKRSLTEADLKAAYKSLRDADINIVVGEDADGKKLLEITEGGEPIADFGDLDTASEAFAKSRDRMELLMGSSLNNLTSIVEIFFSKLFHSYYAQYPDAIGTKEKIFSLEELAEFDSVAEARDYHIRVKIEDMLYRPFAEWIEFLKDRLKLSMSYLDSDLDVLKETFQRRNLIVHNGGVVNATYLKKVSPGCREGIAKGQKLDVDRAYLELRIDHFERACIVVAAELWKKLAPDDEERPSFLVHIAYRHLLAGRWFIAESISYFVLKDRCSSEEFKMIGQLNYWQCKKWEGHWAEVEAEATSADYSGKGLKYQLGLAALCDRADDFFELLPRAIKSEEINQETANHYPISSHLTVWVGPRASEG